MLGRAQHAEEEDECEVEEIVCEEEKDDDLRALPSSGQAAPPQCGCDCLLLEINLMKKKI